MKLQKCPLSFYEYFLFMVFRTLSILNSRIQSWNYTYIDKYKQWYCSKMDHVSTPIRKQDFKWKFKANKK